ncbi:hypothetical protein BGZ96_001617 [Linnemannia gamsii]|uniref:F-box domain-containing protein n=1 Tax=Linnemannia gamsii TaxID=64522 RepID=A0ABQ7JLX5_9FUNG|nr:hypothetical protein BGZ96_001617 [Linnemannia gamsii]
MSRTPRSMTPTELALSLPEVLETLGPFIHFSDLGSCVLVSRLWNKAITPWLWRTVNDSTRYWPNILMDLSYNYPPQIKGDVMEKDEKWLRAVLIKHGKHIRHLDSYIISPVFKGCLKPVPYQKLGRFVRAVIAPQRFWLLVLQNPDLEYLHLGRHLGLSCKGFRTDSIIKILTSLPKLTRLENDTIYRPLQQTLGVLPGLLHYTCLADSGHNYMYGLELDQPFPRLQSLKIKGYASLRTALLFQFAGVLAEP